MKSIGVATSIINATRHYVQTKFVSWTIFFSSPEFQNIWNDEKSILIRTHFPIYIICVSTTQIFTMNLLSTLKDHFQTTNTVLTQFISQNLFVAYSKHKYCFQHQIHKSLRSNLSLTIAFHFKPQLFFLY